MTNILNHNWYDLNSLRPYPLAAIAGGYDDDGKTFPTGIVTDLSVTYPASLGEYLYVGGVTVTANIATVVFLASTSLTSTNSCTPVASITLTQPVEENVVYRMDPLSDQTDGWIVFGEQVHDPISLRFTSPSQSLILDRCTEIFSTSGVLSVRQSGNSQPLTGVIELVEDGSIKISTEALNDLTDAAQVPFFANQVEHVPGLEVAEDEKVIVFELYEEGRSTVDVAQEFAGGFDDKNQIAEYGLCENNPIFTLNGIIAGCTQVFEIIIRGDETIMGTLIDGESFSDGGETVYDPRDVAGIYLGTETTMEELCASKDDGLPNEDGSLDSVLVEGCVEDLSDFLSADIDYLECDTSLASASASSLSVTPYSLDVDGLGSLQFISGGWTNYADESLTVSEDQGVSGPNYGISTANLSVNNITLQANIILHKGKDIYRHNFALLTAITPDPADLGNSTMWGGFVEWDADVLGAKNIHIAKWICGSWKSYHAIVVRELQLETPYLLTFALGSGYSPSATLSISDGSSNLASIEIDSLETYDAESGFSGFYSDRSIVTMSNFIIS